MDVQEKVLELLADAMQQNNLDLGELGLQTPIVELGLDSLKLVEIIYELERDFSVEIGEELLAQLETVADVITAVTSACRGAAA